VRSLTDLAMKVHAALVVDGQSFDVVIVGAGSAGCVVAARLAENATRSVLLAEAGPDLRSDATEGMHDGWGMYREHGWGYESEPDVRGAVEQLHRGRLVGGTSWVTRFAMRGSPADYAEWERLGNDGWGFDDVLLYFVRIENDLDFGFEPWHGSAGPLPITRYPDLDPTPFEATVSRALAANGFEIIDDHNRPGAIGFGRMPRSARDGARVTTADVFLPAGRTPRNLEIKPDAQVADVVLDGSEAVGVRLLDGTVIHAGWVVLCAGTYGSPPILMRSGIGPRRPSAVRRGPGPDQPPRGGCQPCRPPGSRRRPRLPRRLPRRASRALAGHVPQLVRGPGRSAGPRTVGV
jgi:choline dehydrogenase-like flavoprotein